MKNNSGQNIRFRCVLCGNVHRLVNTSRDLDGLLLQREKCCLEAARLTTTLFHMEQAWLQRVAS